MNPWRDVSQYQHYLLTELLNDVTKRVMSQEQIKTSLLNAVARSEHKMGKVEAPTREQVTGEPSISPVAEEILSKSNS